MAELQVKAAPVNETDNLAEMESRDSSALYHKGTCPQNDASHTHTNVMAKIHLELARKSNRRLPINQLPIEILCLIFQFAVKRGSHRDRWYLRLRGVKPAHQRITSVCSHWRNIAVSFPALWTTIDQGEILPYIATLYRQRAGLAPITLKGCDISSAGPGLDLVFSNIYNIKSVDMYHRLEEDVDPRPPPSIQQLTLTPAAQDLILESLQLTVNTGWGELNPVILSEPLFGGRTPLLRHVTFKGVQMPWRRGFYRNLHTLNIRYCGIGSRPSQDEDILHVLRDCPSLRTLALCLKDRNSTSEYISSKPLLDPAVAPHTVRLPSLRDVRLELPVKHLFHLLRFVDFNPARLEVVISESSSANARLAFTLPSLLPHELLGCLDELVLHLSSSRTHHRGSIDGSRTRDDRRDPEKCELSIKWTILRDDETIPMTFNDTMVRRMTQALSPHAQQLDNQEIYVDGELIIPGSIPCALYSFSPGLLLPSRYLHVYDDIDSYTVTDESLTLTPEEWPSLQIVKLSGVRYDAGNTRDWIQWCKRLSEHSLWRWSLQLSTFRLTDEEGRTLAAEITALGLDIVWPIL